MAGIVETVFLALLVILFGGLGVSNFVEAKNEQDQTAGRSFFALMFMILAISLVIYKITNP